MMQMIYNKAPHKNLNWFDRLIGRTEKHATVLDRYELHQLSLYANLENIKNRAERRCHVAKIHLKHCE